MRFCTSKAKFWERAQAGQARRIVLKQLSLCFQPLLDKFGPLPYMSTPTGTNLCHAIGTKKCPGVAVVSYLTCQHPLGQILVMPMGIRSVPVVAVVHYLTGRCPTGQISVILLGLRSVLVVAVVPYLTGRHPTGQILVTLLGLRSVPVCAVGVLVYTLKHPPVLYWSALLGQILFHFILRSVPVGVLVYTLEHPPVHYWSAPLGQILVHTILRSVPVGVLVPPSFPVRSSLF